MIRKIRIASVIFFVVSVIAFVAIVFYTRKTKDYTGPVINLATDCIEVSVKDPESKILEGITAFDGKDGDVSDSLTIVSLGNFDHEGKRAVSIAAFDTHGNVNGAGFYLKYTDYTSPKVQLSGPLSASVSSPGDLLDNIKVVDCLDGDITDSLQVYTDYTITNFDEGDYSAHIQASNSAGDTIEIPVTLTMYSSYNEKVAPRIGLTDYLIYVKKGKKIDPYEYLDTMTIGTDEYAWNSTYKYFEYVEKEDDESDSADTDEYPVEHAKIRKKDIQVENNVDADSDGVYEIVYTYETEQKNVGTVRLTVIVGEE